MGKDVQKSCVLVSACLLGEPCRWHGRAVSPSAYVKRFREEHPEIELVPVCPEQLGGLPTPRPPCKRRGERVWETCEDKAERKNVTGPERTKEFVKGAEATLAIAQKKNCTVAILANWSPSCDKKGITGRLLDEAGIRIINVF